MEASLPPVPPDAISAPASIALAQRLSAVACHLCLFVAGPLLVPFIVWLVAKQDWPFVARHAREALNFHLSLIIYALALVCIALPLVFSIIGIPVLMASVFALALGPAILAILAAIKASEGSAYHYPLTIPIFR